MHPHTIISLLVAAYCSGELYCTPLEPSDTLPEISITAVKQSSRLKYQPVAVTTIDASQIERDHIVALKGVSEIAPNFYMPQYGSRITSSIYVRGIGARMDQPSVAFNVDNVPFLDKDAYDFDVPDIESIEILRGPQATLYGRNAMAGVVNIHTLSPMKFQGLRGLGEVGTANNYRANLTYYHKYSPKIATSIGGDFRYLGGYYRNSLSGKHADSERSGSIRQRTVARLTPSLSLDNVFSIVLNKQDGYPYAYENTGIISYNDTCYYRRTTLTDGLSLKWQHNDITIASVTSFQYIDDDMTLDQDFLPLSYFTLSQRKKEKGFTQDIVATGEIGRYKWVNGIFGFYKHNDMTAPVTFKETGIKELIEDHRNEINPDYPIRWDETIFPLSSRFHLTADGLAIYHRSSLDLGDWNFALGLRLDLERSSLRYLSNTNTSYTVYGPDNEVYKHERVDIDEQGYLHHTFTQFLPAVTITRQFGHSLVYATVAKGYKAGGYNTQMFSDVLQQRIMETMGIPMTYEVDRIVGYKPETSFNYETGVHVTCDDGKVHATAAAFYIDCRNQQLTVFPEGNGTGRIMTNAGKTRSFGCELSMNYTVSDWHFDASYGYTNARFVHFDDGKKNYRGKQVPYAPSNTLFLSAAYKINMSKSALTFCVNIRGVGDIYWDEANTSRQPFYGLLGASAAWQLRNTTVELWGQNLTQTRFVVFRCVSMSRAFYQLGMPARGGITFRFKI